MEVQWSGQGPLPMLYCKTATGAVAEWQCWVEGNEVVVRWGYQGGQVQHSRFKCEPKNVGRSNETTPEQQAINEAFSKWKKQKKKKYAEFHEFNETNTRYRPMGAQEFKKRPNVTYPVDIQPKLNGVRCLAFWKDGELRLQSRGGDPYRVDHIQPLLAATVPGDAMVDGELYTHGLHLQEITSLVKRPREESRILNYYVYDFVNIAFPDLRAQVWDQRRAQLHEWFRVSHHYFDNQVRLVRTEPAYGPNEVQHYHDQFVSIGFEGAIIRTLHGTYRFGYKSPHLLKVKAFEDDEFVIIGCKPGRGKFENAPVFKCRTRSGAVFDVVPEGSAEYRAQLLVESPQLIGRLMKVKFQGYSMEGTPLIPVGLGIRGREDL